jgi:hypothetical protein
LTSPTGCQSRSWLLVTARAPTGVREAMQRWRTFIKDPRDSFYTRAIRVLRIPSKIVNPNSLFSTGPFFFLTSIAHLKYFHGAREFSEVPHRPFSILTRLVCPLDFFFPRIFADRPKPIACIVSGVDDSAKLSSGAYGQYRDHRCYVDGIGRMDRWLLR